jgi:Na+/H+-translocating membrane pyrophosphatase
VCYCFIVCGFEAFINGKHIVGEVKEKEQAHREYKKAISEGHGAYLMDEETPVSIVMMIVDDDDDCDDDCVDDDDDDR